jgi:hypothetical protein
VLTMEEQEDGWLTVLEKNGLGPAAAIFENYGIDSETDLLVLDRDDFSKLAARGLKPLHVKKLERWCESRTCMKLPCGFMRETYSGIHLEIIKVSLVTVKQAWI